MIGNSQEIIQWLFEQDREKQFTIKEYKPKRSLSQNAYAWKLITEIGNILRKSKVQDYLKNSEDINKLLEDQRVQEIINTPF